MAIKTLTADQIEMASKMWHAGEPVTSIAYALGIKRTQLETLRKPGHALHGWPSRKCGTNGGRYMRNCDFDLGPEDGLSDEHAARAAEIRETWWTAEERARRFSSAVADVDERRVRTADIRAAIRGM